MSDIIDVSSIAGEPSSPSDSPSTPEATESAVEDTTGTEQSASQSVSPESTEGATAPPADSQPDDNSDAFDPNEAAQSIDFDSLTDDQRRDVLKAFAETNATPQWAREKLIPSLKLFDESISGKKELEQQLKEVQSSYEGKAALSNDELSRYKELDELMLGVRSMAAKPQDIQEFVKTQNPRAYEKFMAETAWNSFENSDGSPNLDNLQTLVDKFTSYEGDGTRVEAKDVMHVLNRLRDGELEPSELYDFQSDEERTRFEQSKAEQAQAVKDRMEAKGFRDKAESDFRGQIVSQAQTQNGQQVTQDVTNMLKEFNLDYVEGEPQGLAEYKQGVRRMVAYEANRFVNENPHMREAQKATEMLAKAQGVDQNVAQQEIAEYLESQQYQGTLNAGLSALRESLQKQVAQAAKHYEWIARGYEVAEKERLAKAKPIPGKAGQTPQELNLEGLKPNDRNAALAEQLTQKVRAESQMGANRHG